MSGYIVPVALAGAHAYWLYGKYLATVYDGWDTTTESYLVPAAMSVGYAAAVVLGKKIMALRALPFELKPAMLVYNIYITLLSLFMFTLLAGTTIGSGEHVLRTSVDTSGSYRSRLLAFALYTNYNSKFVEFIDTLFIVLRKKDKQASFLHCWHHFVMGPVMWLIVSYSPGGSSFFAPMINSFIHTVMYYYYTMSSLGFKIWWKKYVTRMQLTQFVLILVHACYHLFVNYSAGRDVYWPTMIGYVELFLMFNMLAMFGSFYAETYKAPTKAAKEA